MSGQEGTTSPNLFAAGRPPIGLGVQVLRCHPFQQLFKRIAAPFFGARQRSEHEGAVLDGYFGGLTFARADLSRERGGNPHRQRISPFRDSIFTGFSCIYSEYTLRVPPRNAAGDV